MTSVPNRASATASIDALLPDLRGTPLWERVETHFRELHEPGFDRPGEPADPAISADGRRLACTVAIRSALDGPVRREVLVVDAAAGAGDEPSRLAVPNGSVRLPRWSPVDDDRLAVLVEVAGAPVHPAMATGTELTLLPPLAGTVEQLLWAPDASALLALVAEPGADAAGAQGSGRTGRGDAPAWLPVVMADQPVGGWRRLWRWAPGDAAWRVVSPPSLNCWECCWAGSSRVAVVASTRPDEAAWFDAALVLLDLGDEGRDDPSAGGPGAGGWRALAGASGGRCLGLPGADREGNAVAYVEATCSDRTVVAGDVTLVDLRSGAARRLDLGGLDVTWLGFDARGTLVVAGQRDLSTVVAEVSARTGRVVERWTSELVTCGQRYPELAVSNAGIAMVIEGYGQPPELARLDRKGGGEPRPVTRLRHEGHDRMLDGAGTVAAVRWHSTDGTPISGLLVTPPGSGPHPVVMYVHGGPVWAWRSRWSMGYAHTLLLARQGFAVFHPNPRGSTGRGEPFRRAVIGDLAGAEIDDLLTGLDHLVATGAIDAARQGVLGGSHGGYIAAWLVTVTDRFGAAVPYCPVTEWDFMRLTTNDAAAQDHMLSGRPGRSPLAGVDRVHTPTLVSTGGLDLITPPSQGLAFHRALAERGVPTGYLEYPQEGHGVRSFPAQIDFCARMLGWFEHHIGRG